jgi:hypothetical protein
MRAVTPWMRWVGGIKCAQSGPPIASAYRRRKKNITLEEYWPIIDGHTNITDETTHVATNFRSYLNSKIPERDYNRSNNDNGNQIHQNK